jgi:predicted nucleic acid-binding protein
MRALLDPDVVVAAMRSPRGASAELLRRIDQGSATLLMTVALALEYQSKCMLAKHRLAAELTEEETGAFVDYLIAMAEPVKTHYRWRPQLHDPGNELVLEAAVSGRATHLITFNEKGLRKAEQSFGIAVIPPNEALRRIKS